MTGDTKIYRVARPGASLRAVVRVVADVKSGHFKAMSDSEVFDHLSGNIESPDHAWYLARFGSVPAGFLHAFLNPVYRNEFQQRDYELQVSVLPEHRRKHVASELVRRAVSDARKKGIRYACAFISPANEPSKTFFEAMGFHEDDEIDELTCCHRYSIGTGYRIR